jgi:hypothetical protein
VHNIDLIKEWKEKEGERQEKRGISQVIEGFESREGK